MISLHSYEMEFPTLPEVNHVRDVHDSIVKLWSFIAKEASYQDDSLSDARRQLVDILHTIRGHLTSSEPTIHRAIFISILGNLFSFIAYTRDIHSGLGHRKTTYMMLDAWYECYPLLATTALHTLLRGNMANFAYGSWRDVGGLYDYCLQHSPRGMDHPLIDFSVRIMNNALRKDATKFKKTGACSSNVAKWVPREKSRNGELFKLLALDWGRRFTPFLFQSATSIDAEFSAIRKCKTNYRKLIVGLTQLVDPIEHKMCAKDPVIYSSTLSHDARIKHWAWLRNKDIIPTNSDTHLSSNAPAFTYEFSFPAHLDKYVSLAYQIIHSVDSPQNCADISRLNSQWENISTQWRGHVAPNDLAIIYIESISLHDPCLHRAIAHACLIAQKSGIKRILYASHHPIWINLEICDGFVAYIRTIFRALQDQAISCVNLDNALDFLGENHPFSPIIVAQTGYCYRYDAETNFCRFFDIMDSERYNTMQNAFQNAICN